MLSDEEKEAIEQIRSWREYIIKHKEDVNKANDIEFYLRTAINLIEKQSKEIEDNKKYIDLHYVPYEQYTSKLNELNKKWKDKIKAKIEEINKEMLNEENSLELFYRKKYCKEILQSLLEKE